MPTGAVEEEPAAAEEAEAQQDAEPAAPEPEAPTPARQPTPAAAISDEGVAFIGRHEGFRAELYDDVAGHCTIGFGHLVHRGNCDGTEPQEFRDGITRERGLELLRADAATAERAVREQVRFPRLELNYTGAEKSDDPAENARADREFFAEAYAAWATNKSYLPKEIEIWFDAKAKKRKKAFEDEK